MKKPFYWIELRSVGAYCHLETIHVSYPPIRYTLKMRWTVVIQKHYVFFLHPWISCQNFRNHLSLNLCYEITPGWGINATFNDLEEFNPTSSCGTNKCYCFTSSVFTNTLRLTNDTPGFFAVHNFSPRSLINWYHVLAVPLLTEG